ncbi:MAG: protein kinase [Syntrophobacteraceae bacterium]
MVFEELFKHFQDRVDEARLYLVQGLTDDAIGMLEDTLREIGESGLSDPEKAEVRSLVKQELARIGRESTSSGAESELVEEIDNDDLANPSQVFQYGQALMDGLFWEEAIQKFKRAAASGYRIAECHELCGDCATLLEKWEEAIGYYNLVYKDENVSEDLKRKILIKITRCSQTQKKIEVRLHAQSKGVGRKEGALAKAQELHGELNTALAAQKIASFDQQSISRLIGLHLTSWQDSKSRYLRDSPCAYRVLNYLNVGVTSLIVEIEEEETGKRLAGQGFVGPFSGALSAEQLCDWVRTQMACSSGNLVKVLDLAHAEDMFFVVRENVPGSLVELLTTGEVLPISIAVFMAYRIVEGLGDLHLRMGSDERIHKLYHLDLRPSRILIDPEKPAIKIYNGGFWNQLAKLIPEAADIRSLPLPLLAYRAPEQFRPYLARKKPPVFTDIYLFGTVFYEMLTGIPAFRASSFEEYEIQHCEQYPTPPKVWRPEIPDQLNEMIMRCLEIDPTKRWRSASELSLLLEKPFHHFITPPKDGVLAKLFATQK